MVMAPAGPAPMTATRFTGAPGMMMIHLVFDLCEEEGGGGERAKRRSELGPRTGTRQKHPLTPIELQPGPGQGSGGSFWHGKISRPANVVWLTSSTCGDNHAIARGQG